MLRVRVDRKRKSAYIRVRLLEKGSISVMKNKIILIVIIILLCLAGACKIYSDHEAIRNNLYDEFVEFSEEAKKTESLIIEGGVNPYHKDVDTPYVEIKDTRMGTEAKLFNLMENYFTREYAEKRFNHLLFEKDDKLCMHIVGNVTINDFTTGHIADIKINPISKDAALELFVYSPVHKAVNQVVFRLKSVDGEYRIDEIMVGGW